MTRRKKKSLKKLIYYVKCGWLACEKKKPSHVLRRGELQIKL